MTQARITIFLAPAENGSRLIGFRACGLASVHIVLFLPDSTAYDAIYIYICKYINVIRLHTYVMYVICAKTVILWLFFNIF